MALPRSRPPRISGDEDKPMVTEAFQPTRPPSLQPKQSPNVTRKDHQQRPKSGGCLEIEIAAKTVEPSGGTKWRLACTEATASHLSCGSGGREGSLWLSLWTREAIDDSCIPTA